MALTLNGDDGIAGVDGSAATPAIQGTDSNTGISFGTDTVNVVTGGSTRTTVDSSGRLLVGTSSSRAIGTSSGFPARLQVESTGFTLASFTQNSNDVFGPELNFGKSRGTSTGSNTIVQNGDALGQIQFAGADGTDLATNAAAIEAFVDGTPGSNDMPGRLVFSTTADAASSPTERMRIKNDGRIVAGDGFSTAYGQVFTAAKVGDIGKYFGIGDQGNSANAWSRDSGTSTYTHIQFANGNGSTGTITTSGTSTSYNTNSDYRLKENVVDLDGAIDRVKQLAPKRFNFIADADTTVDGFIAHEAQTVVPEAVIGTHNGVEVWQEGEELPDGVSLGDNKLDEDGNTIPKYQGIDQAKLVPLLTAALQEAIGKIEALETRVAQLEGGAS